MPKRQTGPQGPVVIDIRILASALLMLQETLHSPTKFRFLHAADPQHCHFTVAANEMSFKSTLSLKSGDKIT